MERRANKPGWQGKMLSGCKMIDNFSHSQREICIRDSSEEVLGMDGEILMPLVWDLVQRNTPLQRKFSRGLKAVFAC